MIIENCPLGLYSIGGKVNTFFSKLSPFSSNLFDLCTILSRQASAISSLWNTLYQLVRVFHELHWAEDLGSGTRNILRYAPLYYPRYKIEINSGQQFVFSITYQDENVTVDEKMSSSVDGKMSKGKCPKRIGDDFTGEWKILKKK